MALPTASKAAPVELVELKPHVSFQQALDAVNEFDRIAREAEGLTIEVMTG